MMRYGDPAHLLPWILSNPQRVGRLDRAGWQRLIWQARNADLIGQLEFVLNEAGVLYAAPAAARRHLAVAAQVADKHAQALQWELDNLQEALLPVGVPVILLKGAAYGAIRHRAGRGRLFHDIDILVPRHAIETVEVYLIHAGWLGAHTSPYDERYYREWMHEIPPMEHKNRSSVLDVHHALVPPTSGIRPNAEVLFEATTPLAGPWPQFRVLSPEDMAIHCATHLFFGEFHKGLRDLYDFHTLVSAYAPEHAFWGRLRERSQLLGLERPVADALRHARRLYETEVPEDSLRTFTQRTRGLWPGFLRHWLFDQVLRAPHVSAAEGATRMAGWLATVRSHWLRMPVPLLVYHLSHKLMAHE